MPLLGVPLPLGMMLLVGASVVMTVTQYPPYVVVMLPVWWISKLLVARDYHAPGILLLWLRTAGAALDRRQWGGASLHPLPVRVPPRGRGMVHHDWQ